jgi:DNA-binding NtrC family response regulator
MINTEKKILIIDHDHDERAVMASFLEQESYQVSTGTSLTDAIKKLSHDDFNCLVLDVDLPEMKGYEAVPILKNISPEIQVIMTTKRNTKELESKVREQDIFFYFIKSFRKEELKLAINDIFNNKRSTKNGKCKS